MFAYCSNNPVMYVDSTGYFADALVAARDALVAWYSTSWWLTLVDGPVPVGDAVYVIGGLVAAVVGGVIAWNIGKYTATSSSVTFNATGSDEGVSPSDDLDEPESMPKPNIPEEIAEKDKRLYGNPNDVNVDGYREAHIGDDGRADIETHHTDHGNPSEHSNPHKHIITWGSNGKPTFGKPINLPK